MSRASQSEPSSRAVLYARVSTNSQEEGSSLDTQLSACQSYCAERGLIPTFVFRETWSGLVLDRPQLNQLRELARSRRIDALVSYSTDRISRDPVHLLLLLEEMDKLGVAVHFVTEPRDGSLEGQLITFVRGWTGKLEAVKIAERTGRGRRARARSGRLPTGTARYGWRYIRETGKREINETEATVIRNMVAWIVRDGLSLGGVRARLLEWGIQAPKGGSVWGLSTIRRILRDPALAGESYGYRYLAVEPRAGPRPGSRQTKTRREMRPREEWIDLPDVTPPILSGEEYEALQAALQRNSELQSRGRKHEYLLAGHVWCAACGRRYAGEPNKDRRYYRCVGRRPTVSLTPCRNPQISADALEEHVLGWFDDIWCEPDLLRLVLFRFNKPERRKPIQVKLDVVHKRLDKLRAEEARLVQLFVTGEYEEEILHREKRRINSEHARLTEQREDLTRSLEDLAEHELDDADLEELCGLMEKRWRSMSFEERRQVFSRLKLRVEILPDRRVQLSGLMPVPGVAAAKLGREFPDVVGVNNPRL